LIERYTEIANYLANTVDDPHKDGLIEFAGLYQKLELNKLSFEFFKNKLTEAVSIPGLHIKLERVNFQIVVRARPQHPHDTTKESLHVPIIPWLHNEGHGDAEALVPIGSLLLNSANVEFAYDPQGHKKEPDSSWVPRDINPLHLGVRLIPGTTLTYPTSVIEVGYMQISSHGRTFSRSYMGCPHRFRNQWSYS
jgi:hypothetical protein